MVGPVSVAVIATVAVIIFGPKKLPELGRAMGSTLREFKSATKGLTDEDFDSSKDKKPEEVKTIIVEKIVEVPAPTTVEEVKSEVVDSTELKELEVKPVEAQVNLEKVEESK